MTDLSTISTIISNVKTATDIAKLVKDSSSSLKEAEVKLKMADLISALADIKIELSDMQVLQREKDQRIFELEEQLSKKEKTSYDGKMYWIEDDKTPFCAVCYENDTKFIHLTHVRASEWGSENWYCKICKNKYYV
jgi:hypothetical protein